VLVRAATGAARSQFAVNYYGRHAADSMLLCLGRDLGLVHVMDDDFMRRTGYSLDELNGLLTRRTAGTEDFDFLFRCHFLFLSLEILNLLSVQNRLCLRLVAVRPRIP